VEIEQKSSQLPTFNPSPSTLTILAMVGGLGIILAVLGLAFGAAAGNNANASVVGLAVLSGIFLLIVGVGGWVIGTQPYKHFDDINQPIDDGHHAHGHDEHADSHDTAHTSEAHH
jgi:ABC-type nickel/cobalt efflux system permease component RcnA